MTEMAPTVTHHCGQRSRTNDRLHGDRRHAPDSQRADGRCRRRDVLRRLHKGRREPDDASDHVRVQRRARLGDRLAAPRRVRPEEGEAQRRRQRHRRRPTASRTIRTRSSTRRTSCSSTPSAPATAVRRRRRSARASGASMRTLNSFREFIRLYLTRFDRMGSPKFLAGESYGTTRASGLSGLLADDGIALNGVILLSSVLNFGYSSQVRGNDIGFINFIPTYAATAWYHKKLPADLQKQSVEEVTAAAEKWSVNEYASALMKGNKLTAAERQATIDQMARFTGLSKEIIDQNDLRVALGTFDSELLRDQHETVGRLDGRFTGFAPLSGGRGGGARRRRSERHQHPQHVHAGAHRLHAPRAELPQRGHVLHPRRRHRALELPAELVRHGRAESRARVRQERVHEVVRRRGVLTTRPRRTGRSSTRCRTCRSTRRWRRTTSPSASSTRGT